MSDNIAVLGDVHIGVRNSSPIVCEYQLSYFENEFFPYLKNNNISTILSLGDLWDVRKFTNHVTLLEWKLRFFDYLRDNKIHLITLVGNHDAPLKNTLEGNTSSIVLREYTNVTVISVPTEMNIKGLDFLLLPWICDDNSEEAYKMIEGTDSIFCAGHLELAGFNMQKGVESHGTQDSSIFNKFDLTLSGHYHTRSRKGNILYTGIPFQLTWSDYDDQKGFHVLDTKSHDIKFIKSKSTLFERIEYNDSIDIIARSDLADKYVKVIVVSKSDTSKYDKFITNIQIQNPADLKITDVVVDFSDIAVEDVLELEDTIKLLSTFVEQLDTELDKNELDNIMKVLYSSALEVI